MKCRLIIAIRLSSLCDKQLLNDFSVYIEKLPLLFSVYIGKYFARICNINRAADTIIHWIVLYIIIHVLVTTQSIKISVINVETHFYDILLNNYCFFYRISDQSTNRVI